MLTRLLQTTLVASVIAMVALASNPASAGSYEHIDELAYKLQSTTRTLSRELYYSYRHTSEYPHLRNDVNRLYQLAAHVHEVAHEGGSLDHLRSDVEQLDRAFHHLEEVIDELQHEARHHNGHGHLGHVHGSGRYVRGLMRSLEDTLHHLRDDVNEMWAESHGPVVHPPVFQQGAVQPPIFQPNGQGVSFRAGGLTIRLGR